jgi:uncharacterized protein (DUF305 family)
MKKLIIFSAVIALLSACNNPEKAHDIHSDTTIHADRAPSLTTMQDIMTGMMKRMHSLEPSGNNDADFAAMMLEHHRGAVQMSGLELREGTDSSMRRFAKGVIEAQEKEIAFMTEFIAGNNPQPSADAAAFQQALQGSMSEMMKKPAQVFNQTDTDFAAQMIPHHQSAVDMAKAYIQFGKNDSLLKMCREIISSQSEEIRWLDRWLQSNRP